MLTVQVQDTFGNPVTPTVSTPVTVTFDSTNIGGPFDFLAADSTPGLTQIVISDTTSTASFRYYDETAGTWSISVHGAGLPSPNKSQLLTVKPDTAKQVALVTPPRTVAAGAPSDVITVQRQDQFGNPNTVDLAVTVNLTTSAVTSGVFVTPTIAVTVTQVTISQGTAAANFLYYDSARGTKSITASVSGGYLTPTVSQPVTVTGGTAVRFVLDGPSATVAGVPISLTVTALDSFGNVADGYVGSQTLEFGGASVAANGQPPTVVGHDLGVYPLGAGTPISFTEGVATTSAGANGVLTLYLAETATITAADGPVSTEPDGNLSVIVSAAPSTTVEAQTVGGDLVASQSITSGSSIDIYAKGLDPYRNSTGLLNANWQIAVTGGVTTTDLSTTTGISTTFTGHAQGTAKITPTFGSLVSVPTGVITVTVGAPTQVRVETRPDGLGSIVPSQPISAGTVITMYAVTRDVYGNFVDNPEVDTWSVAGANGVTTSDLITTTGGTFTVFRGRAAGNGTVAANFNGLTVVPSGVITVTPGIADYLKLTAPGTTFTAGTAQELGITAYDAFDNPAVSYNGQKSLTFSGALPSLNQAYTPTVVNSLNTAVPFGQTTAFTFTNGVLDNSGTVGNLTLYRAGSSIPINAGDGEIGSSPTGTLTVTVDGTAFEGFDLDTIAGSSVLTVGVPVQLVVRAVDIYGNSDLGFDNPNRNMTFSGIGQAPNGSIATIVNDGNTATWVTQSIRLDFTDGVAVMTDNAGQFVPVKAETTTINVALAADSSYDSIPNGGLTVTVRPGTTRSLAFSLNSPQPVNEVFVGASNWLTVTDQYKNLITDYNAVAQPITITGGGPLNTGTIRLINSSNTNVLNQPGDVTGGVANLSNIGLGMLYVGTTGTGWFTATAAPPSTEQFAVSPATSNNVTITPGTPVSVTLNGRVATSGPYSPTLSIQAGAPIELQTSLFDVLGNPTVNGSFTLTFTGATTNGTTTPPDPTVTDSSGTVTAFATGVPLTYANGVSLASAGANGVLRLYETGVYTIVASGAGVTTPSGQGLVVTVLSGPLAKLDLQLTSPQTNTESFVGSSNTLTVRDAYDNVLTDWENGSANVSFTVPSSVTSTVIFLNSNSQSSFLEPEDFINGVALLDDDFHLYMNYTGLAGSRAIQAQSGAVTGTATITINPGPMTQMSLSLTSPQTNTEAFVGTNMLTLRDVSGNVVTGWGSGSTNVEFSVTSPVTSSVVFSESSGSNLLVPGDFSGGTAMLGVGGAGLVYTGLAGPATIQAQVGAVTTTAGVTINAGPLAQMSLSLTTLQTNTQEFVGANTLTLRDVSGNMLSGWGGSSTNVEFSVTSSVTASVVFSGSNDSNLLPSYFTDGVATLGAGGAGMVYTGLAGPATIQAQVGAVATSAGVTINAGPLSSFNFVLASPQISGTVFGSSPNQLVALDVSGNHVSGYQGPVRIAPESPLTGDVEGLTGAGNDVLAAGDFIDGVATLTSKMSFIGEGTGQFRASTLIGPSVSALSNAITIDPGGP